uniref:Glutaredoxin n=1 Tax=Grateloupia turuturu TaxID=118375 RepID=A0A6B9P486_9FLOR|nr:glutaredoxin [Grateloupia turuturu]QHD45196.1 glutaredoxin [Grateloupia turuturu]UXC96740.1 glutaredoxin [Grateloupia turuturu]
MTERNIEKLISEHQILVFIKGEKRQPVCGFSKQVINILNNFNVEYHTVNVLQDLEMKKSIKKYSDWPTIPQIYINGEFIGGVEILSNLYERCELGEILEKALNS